MAAEPAFEIEVPAGTETGETLVVGFANPGMVGLTTVDYLVRHADFDVVGHVETKGIPGVAPFADGVPRFPMRLYAGADPAMTVLVSELFVPVPAAEPFVDGVVEWAADAGVREVAVLYGVPYPHGPEEHAVFTVSTDRYRERNLDGTDLQPLGGGVLDGVPGELVTRSLDGTGPPIGVFVTPAHPPGPDLDASLLMLDALETVYGFDVDEGELRDLAAELRQYYAGLADRMRALGEGEAGSRDYPEDRMYM